MKTPTPEVQFLFDFGSPNAYLCHKMVAGLESRTGAQVDYTPILLGGLFKLSNNRSPMEAYGAIPNKLAYERLEMQRFIERHQLLAFKFNPHFPVNTLQAMRLAVAAQQSGVAQVFNAVMFAGMWEQGLNLADTAQIEALLLSAQLDAAALLALAGTPGIKAKLAANTQSAFDRGAFGSPSFFVGDQLYFGKERLGQVEEQISGLQGRA